MATKAELSAQADRWLLQARRRFKSAALEVDPLGKRLIEHGATCYFNCARELQRLIKVPVYEPESRPSGIREK